jgi:uncharacterized protein YuzE
MKIEYDTEHDVLIIEFLSEESIEESVESDGIIIDYTEDRKIVAIEILDAGKRTTKNQFEMLDIKILRNRAEPAKMPA